jgi:hypothetical protein
MEEVRSETLIKHRESEGAGHAMEKDEIEELADKKAEQEKRKKQLLRTAEFIVYSFNAILKKHQNYLIHNWNPDNLEQNKEFMDGIEKSLEFYVDFHSKYWKY